MALEVAWLVDSLMFLSLAFNTHHTSHGEDLSNVILIAFFVPIFSRLWDLFCGINQWMLPPFLPCPLCTRHSSLIYWVNNIPSNSQWGGNPGWVCRATGPCSAMLLILLFPSWPGDGLISEVSVDRKTQGPQGEHTPSCLGLKFVWKVYFSIFLN